MVIGSASPLAPRSVLPAKRTVELVAMAGKRRFTVSRFDKRRLRGGEDLRQAYLSFTAQQLVISQTWRYQPWVTPESDYAIP